MSHLTLVKLFRNLTPEFGAIEVGAELVQVGTTLFQQGVPPSGSAQKPLEPT
jgi:dihydroorotate dehydrogenase